ncbi:hypothetical protein FO519_000912 [Halicephalobus sp. NKZ332]|nr:hypothetical protein FO519_000912 [Halicephalobus sp. NKZ332]
MFPENVVRASFERVKTKYNTNEISAYSNSSAAIIEREIENVAGINILGIIVICTAFGIMLSKFGERAKALADIFILTDAIVMKIVSTIMWFAPIGITSMITANLLEMDDPAEKAALVAKYFVTVLLALAIHAIIVMPLLYYLICRKNPLIVVRTMAQSLITTFGTSSSGAALPLSIQCLEDGLKVDCRVTRFILPLGCNINMDGNALYDSIAVIFIAQLNGMQLTYLDAFTISVISTLASLGLNSVPAGLVSILVILGTVGLPTADLPLIITIDWLIDRIRTTVTVLGDAFVTDAIGEVVKNQLETNITHDGYQQTQTDEIDI